MIRAAKYRAGQDTEDFSWCVFMTSWNEDGSEHTSVIQNCKDRSSAEKAAAKWQAKEDKGIEKEKKEQGKKFLFDYLVTEYNFRGASSEAIKFAKRYLSEDQIKNIMSTGKSK